ncbi:diacylglycerol acyltransferase, partial [Ostertagia ostertagi]
MFIRPIRFLGIDWEPLIVPSKSRLETLAVVHFMFLWINITIISTWVDKLKIIISHLFPLSNQNIPLQLPFYILFFTRFWWVMVLYFSWTYYDFDRPRRGIAISHPHGVLSIGAFTAMVTSGTGFPDMFPGLKSTILTLNGQFWFPFPKGYLALVLVRAEAVLRKSLEYLYKSLVKGRAIAIVLGGATEALDAHPGTHDLNLSSRRGFCRYALKYGADLVPMYHFGENDVFDRWEGYTRVSLRRNSGNFVTYSGPDIETWIKNKFGFCPPLVKGRGIFNYSLGMLPHRRPITTVIGAPIKVTQTENPTEQEIDVLHAKYCRALVDLFEQHKSLHDIPKDVHLTIH